MEKKVKMSTNRNMNSLSGVPVQTTTTISPYSTSPYSTIRIDGIRIGSESLSGLIEDSIKECLAEEDKDGTLSKLITSIVLDKMFELSDMSEDELVETAVYKRISDKVSQRLNNIESRLSALESQMSRLLADRYNIFDSPDTSPYNYSYNTTVTSSSVLSKIRSIFTRDKSDQI